MYCVFVEGVGQLDNRTIFIFAVVGSVLGFLKTLWTYKKYYASLKFGFKTKSTHLESNPVVAELREIFDLKDIQKRTARHLKEYWNIVKGNLNIF